MRPAARAACNCFAGVIGTEDFARPRQRSTGSIALARKLRCSYTVSMNALHFEWDERKAAANEKKHGVSFQEAKSVFFDERAKLIDDPDHSEQEDRFILLGLSSGLRVLVVCHCCRDSDRVLRIISARRASKMEAKFYP